MERDGIRAGGRGSTGRRPTRRQRRVPGPQRGYAALQPRRDHDPAAQRRSGRARSHRGRRFLLHPRGRADVHGRRRRRRRGPGTFVLVPPGVPHSFGNRGDAVVRLINVHAPAGFDLRLEQG
ncbi:MAG: cupin domain-containing protein [Gaiellaceae bacterium]